MLHEFWNNRDMGLSPDIMTSGSKNLVKVFNISEPTFPLDVK